MVLGGGGWHDGHGSGSRGITKNKGKMWGGHRGGGGLGGTQYAQALEGGGRALVSGESERRTRGREAE